MLRLTPNVTRSWKTYFWAQAIVWENSIENPYNVFFKIKFFAYLDEATIKPSCYEISYQKLLFPGDMDDNIRPTDVPKR